MVPDAADVLGRPVASSHKTTHRASYILERGHWNATCRDCGWQTSSPKRQLAASLFRVHILAMRMAVPIDGTADPTAPGAGDAGDQGRRRR
jgi:hypothetical protein